MDPTRRMTILVCSAIGMQALVWAMLIYLFGSRHIGYGFYDLSDIGVYYDYTNLFARGLYPYSSINFEYPPLALPLMILPTRYEGWTSYDHLFAGEMILCCAAAASFATAAAAELWQGMRRPLFVAIAFAAAVSFSGPIIANRYDAAVALDMAIFAFFLARRWWWPAAAALGIGFALKLMPAMFLPLVFILAAERRKILWAAVAFLIAAFLPFLPHLARAGLGVLQIFTYHSYRPLQIESLLATPYLLGYLTGFAKVMVGTSFGSQGIEGAGTREFATLSLYLMTVCISALYLLVWRRRSYLRQMPAEVPPVALGVVLLFVCTSKVLSPQFLIWTFPLVALVTAAKNRETRWIGYLLLGVTLLTQIGFPAFYMDLVHLRQTPILLVTARNLGLLGVLVLSLIRIFKLPLGPSQE